MTNTLKCQDCPITATRGNMHIRSISLRQVGFCADCWEIRQRLEQIVRAVREGIAA